MYAHITNGRDDNFVHPAAVPHWVALGWRVVNETPQNPVENLPVEVEPVATRRKKKNPTPNTEVASVVAVNPS